MGKMTFGYWNLRGRGDIARMMFEYAGVEFENKRYDVTKGPDGELDYPEWKKEKNSLDLAFPNLPYLLDGEVRLTESWAIYKYLARKFGLYPLTETGEYECDMVAGVLMDVIQPFGTAVYSPNLKNLLEKTKEGQKTKLGQINMFLAGRQYVTEDRLTFIDFALYEHMDWHRLLYPDIFDNLPSIRAFTDRFESLERIDAFFKSARYKKFPIFSPAASWGGKDHNDKDW